VFWAGVLALYMHFIEGFADIASPLNKLTLKDAKVGWYEQYEGAFYVKRS
jgi:hypothetical protein